jgi:hypothetical protein
VELWRLNASVQVSIVMSSLSLLAQARFFFS